MQCKVVSSGWGISTGLGWMAALVVAATVAGPGAAQQANCANPMSQVEINFCTELAFQTADDELNRAYRSAREVLRQVDADLPAPQRGAEIALRDGQRAWITFRDQACLAEAYVWTGGSGYPMALFGCKTRLTRARAADLWDLGRGY